MNPKIWINLEAIRENSSTAKNLCNTRGIHIDAVVKGVCADPRIARAIVDGGITSLMDSRMANLQRLRNNGFDCRLGLLRIPMINELKLLVEIADWCVVSMPEVIFSLEKICAEKEKIFDVLLMVDLGDLREGIWPDKLDELTMLLRSCRWVRCIGVGSNLGCFGGVLPSRENLERLVGYAQKAEESLNLSVCLISAGGTLILFELLNSQIVPSEINHLRVGGGILRGKCKDKNLIGFRQDTMLLEAELIEIYTKPSTPIGTIGENVLGETPVLKDSGNRKRGVLALGAQDTICKDLEPKENGVVVLGASSDHLVIDIHDFANNPQMGATISFRFKSYSSMLMAFNSFYVEKCYY